MDELGAVDRLLHAIQELSRSTELGEVQRIVRSAARDLADCDGATFVLRDGDLCYYADEDAIEPLWKGMRFPLEDCISGWSMLHRKHVVIPDIYLDPRIPHEAYRPTFVRSLVMTPIRSIDPVGAIGAYWADHHEATDREVNLLRSLADATSLALEKVSIHRELEAEVALAHEAHRLAYTDPLTGLVNRRGFTDLVTRALAGEHAPAGALAFVDIDGLKAVNDRDGHAAGDRLIADVAAAVRASLRPDAIAGRLGGDEFAVFAPGIPAPALRDRLTSALAGRGSVGVSVVEAPDGLPNALLEADAEMYAAKRSQLRAAN